MGTINIKGPERTEDVRRRWDRCRALGVPGSIMAHAADTICCLRWEVSVLTGGTGWTVKNIAAIGRPCWCPLKLIGISVSATVFKAGP